jgi:hypothetical protein
MINPAILRGARRFCATGIPPVLGHGRDRHGTASVAALPRCGGVATAPALLVCSEPQGLGGASGVVMGAVFMFLALA